MIRLCLVFPTMAFVFRGVSQQVAVQLLDVVLGRCDLPEVREDRFHGPGVSRDFLLVT